MVIGDGQMEGRDRADPGGLGIDGPDYIVDGDSDDRCGDGV